VITTVFAPVVANILVILTNVTTIVASVIPVVTDLRPVMMNIPAISQALGLRGNGKKQTDGDEYGKFLFHNLCFKLLLSQNRTRI